MEWVTNNWFFILFAAVFIGMHFFGYGCGHGSHSRHGAEVKTDDNNGHPDGNRSVEKAEKKRGGCCG